MKLILSFLLVTSAVYSNDTFIDTKNKLMWQDNQETIKVIKPFVTRNNFFNKDYQNIQGDTANNYCKNLDLNDFKDWRLPSIEELKKLNLIQANLQFNKRGTYYWSSTYNPKAHNKVMVGHDMSQKSPLWSRSLTVGNLTNTRCVRELK